MLNADEAKNKKFETNAHEIMAAGSKVLEKMIADRPHLIMIRTELSMVVAATAARWTYDMQKKEK